MKLNQRQSLIYNLTGQVVEFYPPHWPLSDPENPTFLDADATYSVYANDADLDDDPEFTGTSTMDPVDTKFDSSGSGVGETDPTKCNLLSGTNLVAGRYYLGHPESSRGKVPELIGPIRWDFGTNVCYSQYPLQNFYDTSDVFWGFLQYFTIDATFIQDENKIGTDWKILWEYAIAGTNYKAWQYFDVVRQKYETHVHGQDLYESFPDLRNEQHQDLHGQEWQHILDRAKKRVEFDLRKYGMKLDQIRTEAFDELILSRAKWELATSGWKPPGRDQEIFVQDTRQEYFADLNSLRQNAEVDSGTDGGADARGSRKLTFRR